MIIALNSDKNLMTVTIQIQICYRCTHYLVTYVELERTTEYLKMILVKRKWNWKLKYYDINFYTTKQTNLAQ